MDRFVAYYLCCCLFLFGARTARLLFHCLHRGPSHRAATPYTAYRNVAVPTTVAERRGTGGRPAVLVLPIPALLAALATRTSLISSLFLCLAAGSWLFQHRWLPWALPVDRPSGWLLPGRCYAFMQFLSSRAPLRDSCSRCPIFSIPLSPLHPARSLLH